MIDRLVKVDTFGIFLWVLQPSPRAIELWTLKEILKFIIVLQHKANNGWDKEKKKQCEFTKTISTMFIVVVPLAVLSTASVHQNPQMKKAPYTH